MSLNCRKLFAESHLHLLVWDRFADHAHDAGLRLAAALIGEAEVRDGALVLVRPLGRPPEAYDAYADVSTAVSGTGLPPPTPSVAGTHLGCCELWVQVGAGQEAAVWARLQRFAEDAANGPARAWRSYTPALWQPLSNGLVDCLYAEARGLVPALWLSRLEVAHTAWFLKTIWHRAMATIAKRCVREDSVARIAPWCQQGLIADLLQAILSPFELDEFAIPGPPGPVDPSAFGASHLAAFALNAVTQQVACVDPTSRSPIGTTWQLEQFWRDPDATWPHRHPSLGHYLTAIRGIAS